MTLNKTPKIYDNSYLFMSIHGKVLHISCIYLGLSPNIVTHINYVFSVQSVFPDVAMCLFSMVVTLSGPFCHLVCSLQTVQSHIGIQLLCLKPKVASCICYPLGLTLG